MTHTTGTPRIPVATYRLQFNAGFTFRHAAATVDYLASLGITDVYASSYLKAVPGSGHGYDVADPTRLNPEVGSEEEYWEWIARLTAQGMGQVLDLVPNHMGIAHSSNPWWLDVLENGPCSRYARFFDIEWHPVKDELANKVLIPILGEQYGVALERQDIRVVYGDGAFSVQYYDDHVPLAPDTYPRIIQPGLDEWLASTAEVSAEEADELRSVLTAAAKLPSRTAREPEAIAERAREKELVKRRLAMLVDQNGGIAAHIARALERLNGRPDQPRSFDELDALLNEQSYRLAHWRVASEEINYRRFFDVNTLAALRMEDPEVFDEVHRLVFELVRRRAATGLRVDHVDGLYAPPEYLRRLQARAAELTGDDAATPRPLYLVVEKILGADEALPPDWPVHGTTGYEFAFWVNSLFVDSRQERAFDGIYHRFLGRREPPSFEDIAYRSKKLVMHHTMSGDINWLGHQLNRFSERHRYFRDFTLYSLIATLKEVIACFPVYRTYITADGPVSDADRARVTEAVTAARRRATAGGRLVFDFVQRMLLQELTFDAPDAVEERTRFIGKFQQITSPVAAKGIEDTSLYVFNRLLSLNEVGSEPTRFGQRPADVHAWMEQRRRAWPSGLSATSTHDTKRGEDLRARLNVLSEVPGEWKAAVTRWRALNRRFKTAAGRSLAPDANEEYLLYQTLVGVWPFDQAGESALPERLHGYVTKALREAKVNTSWLSPDEEYEAAVHRFVDHLLDKARPFRAAFLPFQARVAELGIYNSLAQLVIKIAAPGVPDFYQGTELWDLSLVDPDNRRQVDYELRRRLLSDVQSGNGREHVAALLERRADGRIKLYTTTRGLHARAALRAVFEQGEYVPLDTGGAARDHVFAFARRHGDEAAIACVPRMVAQLLGGRATPPIGTEIWADTHLVVPSPMATGGYRNVFTDERIIVENGTVPVADLFAAYPVALLIRER